jgi:hypothetical protein
VIFVERIGVPNYITIYIPTAFPRFIMHTHLECSQFLDLFSTSE